jgi:acyl-homoserine-lactone acylase
MTRLSKDGIKGKWLLTYSQSENPASKHWDDQTKQFSQSKFIPMAFTEAQIKRDPKLKVTKLKGK